MKKILMAALAACGLAFAAQAASPVAVIGTVSSYDADVVAKLTATGRFSSVTYINASQTTPTLAQLSNYASVLVYSDATFQNGITLGNNLDAYLHAGGGVVVAMFADSDGATYGLADSAFANDFAINPASFQGGANHLTLGTVNLPNDPLMAGVTSFDNGVSGYYNPNASLVGDAVSVANYANGVTMIAKRTINGNETVDLNFYPPSSDARSDFWKSSTDGTTIIANALQTVGLQSAVPEPASWAMMIAGFGFVGASMRRRKAVSLFV